MKLMSKAKYFLSVILCSLILTTLTEPALGAMIGKTIQVYTGVNIYVDDTKLNPKDANGNPVEAFIYNGTTYLPVRAVGEAVGKTVQWEGKTSSVYIGKHTSDKPAVWLDELDYFDSSSWKLEAREGMKDNLGNVHEHAVTACGNISGSPGEVYYTTYKLNGQYSAISGTFFRTYKYRSSDNTDNLKIYGDGELLYSASVTSGVDPIDFYVDLTGVLELKICYGKWWYYSGIGNCGLWT